MLSNNPAKSNFAFGAFVAAFVMILIAAALYVHAVQTRHWIATLKNEASARAKEVTLDVPVAGLQAASCPPDQPVLIGFDANGKARCRAVNKQSCPTGQYISSIDPTTLEIKCSDAGGPLACSRDTYVTEFLWLGENRVAYSCLPRLNPFEAWKFEPMLGSRGEE